MEAKVKTKKACNSLNKIALAAGLVALGQALAQAQYIPGLTDLEMTKPWALSTDVRGFYDDNYLTAPRLFPSATGYSHPPASWGTDIAPSAAIDHSAENTLISASYIFDARWYENHSMVDLTHEFNGHLEHEFGEHYKLSVNESFVVAQEPTVIDPAIVTEPLRIPGDNVRNTGQVDFTASLTKDFDLHLGYGNTVYAYQQTARSVVGYGLNEDAGVALGPYAPQPSRSIYGGKPHQEPPASLATSSGVPITPPLSTFFSRFRRTMRPSATLGAPLADI
jgi:hypothetical protein